jgi:transposase
MRIIGCDLHASQQTIAMLDRETGEMVERTLTHEGETVREFYGSLPAPVVVGIEATGSMGWFLRLMDELGITCQVGHPTKIRKAETRRQKHDRRDAGLLLTLLAENRFPAIWLPSTELRDLRALLLHRHQWVRMRTRVQSALHAIALAQGVRRGHALWNRDGQTHRRDAVTRIGWALNVDIGQTAVSLTAASTGSACASRLRRSTSRGVS